MENNINKDKNLAAPATRASKIMEENKVTEKRKSVGYTIMTSFSIIFAVGILLFIIGYVSVRGIPYLKPSLFSFEYNSENVSMMPALVTTLYMVIASIIISSIIGISTAIYLLSLIHI